MHDLATDALSIAVFMDGNPFDIIGPEATNLLSARWHQLGKESPGKTWWDAQHSHPAIARALRIDPAEDGAIFAIAPFRLAQVDGKYLILAAYPAPRILGPVDGDWLDIQTVIAWDPVSDKALVLGDPEPQIIGAFASSESGHLYASPRDFFTDWMRARAAFFVRWVQSRTGVWAHGATETDLIPGKLIIGNPERIAWRPTAMPTNLTCTGIDAARLNRLLLKSARIPRVRNESIRVAA